MGVVTTIEARASFLRHLAQTRRVCVAARAAGLSRSRAYELKSADAVFAAAWDAALGGCRAAGPPGMPISVDPARCSRGQIKRLLRLHDRPITSPPGAGAAATRGTTRAAADRFLQGLAYGLPVADAARAAGLSRASVYRLKATDAGFAEALQETASDLADALLVEARRRAMEGVEITLPCGFSYRVYDDELLMFLIGHTDRRLPPDKPASIDSVSFLSAEAPVTPMAGSSKPITPTASPSPDADNETARSASPANTVATRRPTRPARPGFPERSWSGCRPGRRPGVGGGPSPFRNPPARRDFSSRA